MVCADDYGVREAVLRKSTEGPTFPIPAQTHPATFVTGMPRAVKPFRTAKFAVVQRIETAERHTAWEFQRHVLEAVPYQVHTVLTDQTLGTPLVRGQWRAALSTG